VKPALAFIGCGSNLAHPRRRLAYARQALVRLPGVKLVRASPNYASVPIDPAVPQPDFVNAVVMLRTTLAPQALLARLTGIERRQGRQRNPGAPRNLPRTLDLDLLLYGRQKLRLPGLTVPHPRMHERAFVLRPLTDIAPHVTIPGRGLARRFLPSVSGQRSARTRRHALR
jgi:2-amino-4-hydroxy-6-hydroxymethyldihydropteridine diphosphokinase